MSNMIANDIQEFCQNMTNLGPIIGIDFGIKKLGIAISNHEHTMSLPLKIISSDAGQLEEIIKQYDPCGLVIGLPVNMDGTTGSQANLIKTFAQKIAGRFNLPIFLQDERLTTRAAGNALKILGLSRKKRDERDDQVAAAMILETALNNIRLHKNHSN